MNDQWYGGMKSLGEAIDMLQDSETDLLDSGVDNLETLTQIDQINGCRKILKGIWDINSKAIRQYELGLEEIVDQWCEEGG